MDVGLRGKCDETRNTNGSRIRSQSVRRERRYAVMVDRYVTTFAKNEDKRWQKPRSVRKRRFGACALRGFVQRLADRFSYMSAPLSRWWRSHSNPHTSHDQELRMYCSLTYFDDVAAIIASPQFAQRWSNNTTSELRKPNIIFVKALKVSLRLRQRRPNSRVKYGVLTAVSGLRLVDLRKLAFFGPCFHLSCAGCRDDAQVSNQAYSLKRRALRERLAISSSGFALGRDGRMVPELAPKTWEVR